MDLELALNHFLGRDPIVMGDLNADIVRLHNLRNQQYEDILDGALEAILLGGESSASLGCLRQTKIS